jgi:hypothetical protein
VVRRTNGGRAQVSLAREGHWTADIEADFLKRLRATGNLSASALAVGFQPASVRERVRRWPAFARACSEAIEEAGIALDYALVARAHALLRTDGEALPGEEEVPFDPDAAMRILAYIERRRGGGGGRRRGKGPPQRSYEEARDSILAKIEAIERHERMAAARTGEGEA